jgi:hypothetical protein
MSPPDTIATDALDTLLRDPAVRAADPEARALLVQLLTRGETADSEDRRVHRRARERRKQLDVAGI